jgi:hypothetical protein
MNIYTFIHMYTQGNKGNLQSNLQCEGSSSLMPHGEDAPMSVPERNNATTLHYMGCEAWEVTTKTTGAGWRAGFGAGMNGRGGATKSAKQG